MLHRSRLLRGLSRMKNLPKIKKPLPRTAVIYPHRRFYFPSIYQIFPEASLRFPGKTFLSKVFLLNFLSVFILMAVLIQGNLLFNNWKNLRESDRKKALLGREIVYWQEVLQKYTNYRDGYYSLALLYYKQGNLEKARQMANKTLDLDPNFTPSQDLIRQIGN